MPSRNLYPASSSAQNRASSDPCPLIRSLRTRPCFYRSLLTVLSAGKHRKASNGNAADLLSHAIPGKILFNTHWNPF